MSLKISIFVLLTLLGSFFLIKTLTPLNKNQVQTKIGDITSDEVWSGKIYVSDVITVRKGATLTIKPGTVVKFKYDRNYKTFHRGGLKILRGTIKAIGTPQKQIWFTSAAAKPINGDWNGINIEDSQDSEFKYVIVEYGEMGVEQFDSSIPVTNSIIRWSNAEGLYAERSEPYFENNTLYGNGYHDIALEQFNRNVKIINNYFHDSHYSIHQEETQTLIKGNYFANYKKEVITAGQESKVIVSGNTFVNVNKKRLFMEESGAEIVKRENIFAKKANPPKFDYKDIKKTTLGYIPGDPNDKFPYIYDKEDETRKVIKVIGKDLGFGWTLTYAKGFLWKLDFANFLVRIDPKTSEYKMYDIDNKDQIINPRGLTWDGRYFWVNDFSLHRISKFTLKGNKVKFLKYFDIPYKNQGGNSGLASDGAFLYYRSRKGDVIKLNKDGKILDVIKMGGASLVWTGKYFWAAYGGEKGIGKYTKDGKLVGEIYPPAKDPWAIAWDGKYLWTLQRTSETWNDPKIFQMKIKDDSL